MADGQPHDGCAPEDYYPEPGAEWRYTRPFDIGYKEDSAKKETHDMLVRIGGITSDMTVSQGGVGQRLR